MSSDPDYEFLSRPLSIEEALALRKQVPSFAYTAPTVGLQSRETGQGTNAKAVVGLYVGIANGGHYFGFNRDTEEWKSVSISAYDGRPTRVVLAQPLDDLMTYLERMYPGEPLVSYGLKDKRMN